MKTVDHDKAEILVCDDTAGVRESLKLILGKQYTLAYVTNGEEAVQYVKAHHPKLIIMDIKMPKMGGLDALRLIKRIRPKIRVIMATGYESSDVAVQAVHLGADDYLVKPFDREQVRTKVRVFLPPPKFA